MVKQKAASSNVSVTRRFLDSRRSSQRIAPAATAFKARLTAENLKNNGPCAKFLEEGDVLTLDGYALSPGYYQFLSCIHGDGGSTSNMPLMATQPVNAPTNLHGDGYVLGYFAVCSTLSTSVTVTDPYQVIEYHP